MPSLLGIDIGTMATKVSIVSHDGHVLSQRSTSCVVDSPHPGWAQVEVDQWWSNVCSLIPEVIASTGGAADDIVAVGVSGMVPTLICLDHAGRPIGPSLQQNDARARNQIAKAQDELADHGVLRRTGSAITTQSVGPKVRWLRKHNPEAMERTTRICGSYDWIVTQLTGVATTETNWALESGLWDLQTEDWGSDLLSAFDVDPSWLAPLARSDQIVGRVTSASALATGLSEGTPVTAGAADHIASALSAGLTNNGDMLIKLGGAGDILLALDKPVVDERVFLDHHLLPGQWILNGCMAASGSLLRWFQRELAADTPFNQLDAEATKISHGSDGLICLPYFLGEKSPINDPDARGAFVGLHFGHTRAHLYRSILEAIGYGFAHHVEVFEDRGLSIGRVRVTNGGSRSRLWRQIVSDIIERPLESIVDHPGSGLGAAFAAGVAVGVLEWSDIDRFVRVDEVITPQPKTREQYRDSYATYRQLYPALTPISERLARMQGAWQ